MHIQRIKSFCFAWRPISQVRRELYYLKFPLQNSGGGGVAITPRPYPHPHPYFPTSDPSPGGVCPSVFDLHGYSCLDNLTHSFNMFNPMTRFSSVYWRFQGISIKRVIFSRSPGAKAAKLHQYRLNCRHIYVDLMAIETMKSFICFDSIDYLCFSCLFFCVSIILN